MIICITYKHSKIRLKSKKNCNISVPMQRLNFIFLNSAIYKFTSIIYIYLSFQGLFSRITFREPVFLGGTGNITGLTRKLPVFDGLTGCIRKFIANEHEYEFSSTPYGDVLQGFDVRKYYIVFFIDLKWIVRYPPYSLYIPMFRYIF